MMTCKRFLMSCACGVLLLGWGVKGRIGEIMPGIRKLEVVEVIGGTGEPPESALPLSFCQGDCDNDSEVRFF